LGFLAQISAFLGYFSFNFEFFGLKFGFFSTPIELFSPNQGRREGVKGVTVSRGPGLKRGPGNQKNKRKIE
jgi:hypothetical protein